MKTVSVTFTNTRETDKTGPARRNIWFGSIRINAQRHYGEYGL